jgi:predicted esterase YcpF (UPF0227 family)
MFIYLHGFASSSQSHKARALRAMLTGHRFVVLNYPAHRVDEALPHLIDAVNQHAAQLPSHERIVLIGSSLGGFYARLLARKLDCIHHVVMINPALSPCRELQQLIGQHRNYQTGELFTLSAEDVAAFAPYEAVELPEQTGLTILLDEGDEVIPFQEAYERYRERGHLIVYPGGSHAFEHLPEAVGHITKAHCEPST